MTLYPIFISSPGDRHKEREYAEEVLAEVGATIRDSADLVVSIVKWEKLPPVMARADKTKQEEINELISECKAFILILGARYGSIEPGATGSNTEREIDKALSIRESRPGFQILAYFKTLYPEADAEPQREQLESLKLRLREKGIFHYEYRESEDFKERLTHDLYKILLNFRISNTKTMALRCFWRMGVVDGPTRYNTMIIFAPAAPPCTKLAITDSSQAQATEIQFCDLVTRVAPLVVFEDYKAILTLSRSLQLVGVTNVGDCAIDFIPRDIEMMNRIWLCLPRNIPGRQQLERYKARRRFAFVSRRNRPCFIEWNSSNKTFRVESPLNSYKEEQTKRKVPAITDSRSIIAKDFAVIARFCDDTRQDMEKGHLMDYFFAGIRGLGTWGAAWFVARRYSAFLQMGIADDSRDVQLLVEITYNRGRITEVVDVSDQPERYFREQNSLARIRKEIAFHKHAFLA
jgi:hypothetical protein